MAVRRESGRDTVARLVAEIDLLERQTREAEVSYLNIQRTRNRLCSNGVTPGGEAPGHSEFVEHFRKPLIMPDIFDGETKWDQYRAHFTACAEINGWTDIERCKFFVARLKGHAQEVYMGLPPAERGSFSAIVGALSKYFAPPALICARRAKLRSRVRGEGEGLSQLCSAIRREVSEAYPSLDARAQGELAVDCFVGALRDRDFRIEVRKGRPKTTEEALHLALELEAFEQAEGVLKPRRQAYAVSSPGGEVEGIVQRLDKLEIQLAKVLEGNARTSHPRQQVPSPPPPPPSVGAGPTQSQCWRCGQWGHISWYCPLPPVGQSPGN